MIERLQAQIDLQVPNYDRQFVAAESIAYDFVAYATTERHSGEQASLGTSSGRYRCGYLSETEFPSEKAEMNDNLSA